LQSSRVAYKIAKLNTHENSDLRNTNLGWLLSL